MQSVVPPRMNICIMVVGTRGDVQPFLGIGKKLQRDGHRVRLATHAIYRPLVTVAGLEFYPLGGDPKELVAYMVKSGGAIDSNGRYHNEGHASQHQGNFTFDMASSEYA
jgi:UDP:flavonoid glycosyltransferase YjiC (YdhE family)